MDANKIQIISQMKYGTKQAYHRSGFIIYYQDTSCKWAEDGRFVKGEERITYEEDISNLTNFKLEIVYDEA